MLLVALAGLNVLVFYVAVFKRFKAPAPHLGTPAVARIFGAVSLICWTGVIICGRLITFYRPYPCPPDEALAFLIQCIPRFR
jgi:hypothetical protein